MSKKLVYLIVCLLTLSLQKSNATHLLGGHIQYSYVRTEGLYQVYDITLTLYRDCTKDGTDEEVPFDQDMLLCVFNADKSLNSSIVMPKTFEGSVSLQNPGMCEAAGTFCMKKAFYRKTIKLRDSADGYYLISERCCRGYYKNIIRDANNNPFQGFSLMAFIPPSHLKNKSPYYNKSHQIQLCEGDTIYWDQTAIDPDNDSLSYKMTRPFLGASDLNPLPDNCSTTYNIPGLTKFETAFSETDIFGNNGFSTLNDSSHMLTLFSVDKGLFLGSIEVSEWRNQVLISRTNFDFTAVVDVMAGVSDMVESGIQIFPNPAKQLVLINGLPPGTNSWQLVNSMGVEVLRGETSGELKMDVSELSDGLYFFKTSANGTTFSQKLIVAK